MEQEGGAGHRTSHQTFKGDSSVIMAALFIDSAAARATRAEMRDLKKRTDVTLKLCLKDFFFKIQAALGFEDLPTQSLSK